MRNPHLVAALAELVSIPTVSSDPARVRDMQRCAQLLARHLRSLGFERVQLAGDRRRPFVYGERLRARGRPTVLVYAHYDVVAAEPAAFRPVVRGAYMYGRGASDDKGPLLCHLLALRREPPLNVRIVLDGEEEIGSPALVRTVTERPELFAADVAIVSDTRMLGPGRPTLVYGLRGKLDAEVTVRGPARDLHSGQFGGVVPNPANALCALVASMPALPGLREGVRPRDLADPTSKPALDVTGLIGGHTGPGAKGIVPAAATAKLSFRLAPGQSPDRIAALLVRHCSAHERPGVRVEVATSGARRPLELSRGTVAQRVAARAATTAFGRAPRFVRSGGSIMAPVLFHERLGLESVLLGFALPDDGMHGPRERVHLPTLERGVVACTAFLEGIARRTRTAAAA